MILGVSKPMPRRWDELAGRDAVDLIVQPTDGWKPIVAAITGAQKSVDIVIFRFDLKEVEKAAEAAVERGVKVRALIAHTNSGG